jgi:glycerol-3-phosphate acyltransferase PlsY
MLVIILIYLLEANGIWYNPLVINGDSLYVLYGIAAVIGHCFPIYIKFKGGKAVATSLGVLLITVPLSGVCALVVFLAVLLITGIVSISSTCATLAAWISAMILYAFTIDNKLYSCLFLITLVILIVLKHIPNYKRLLNGTENSFKKKKVK